MTDPGGSASKYRDSDGVTSIVLDIITTFTLVSGWILNPIVTPIFIILYLLKRQIRNRMPKLLILRRFGNYEVETLLRFVSGSVSGTHRPIWLYDGRADRKKVRYKGATNATHTLLLSCALVLFGYSTIGVYPNNLPAEVLHVSWFVFGTVAYRKYVAGGDPTAWLACLGALIVAMGWPGTIYVEAESGLASSWSAVFFRIAIFLAGFTVFFIIFGATPARRIAELLAQRRLVVSESNSQRLLSEARGGVWFPRYLPTAPVAIAEIIVSPKIWGDVVYDLLGLCQIVIADVSGLSQRSSLMWELEQAKRAGIPIFLTCEKEAYASVRPLLDQVDFDDERIYVALWSKELVMAPVPQICDCDIKFFTFWNRFTAEAASKTPGDARPTKFEALVALRRLEQSE